MVIAADVRKRIQEEKAVKVFEIIEKMVNEKYYGYLKINFQAGQVVNCEKNESIKV